MTKVNIELTLEEVNLLNEFIQSSTPNIKFGIATNFIANIQKQIRNQLQNQNKENEG